MRRFRIDWRSIWGPLFFFGVVFLLVESVFWFKPPDRQVDPYHVSFVTHDGMPISTSRGPIQLSLSPFTLYKSLPHQDLGYLSINSMGLRGGEIPPKRSGVKRILVLGASTAFGFGAESDGDTFVQIWDGLSNEYEVINGAVIGFNAAQEKAYLLSELFTLQPDWVVTVDGYADIFDAWHGYVALGRIKEPREMAYNLIVMPQIEGELLANYRTQTSALTSLGRFMRTLLRSSASIRVLDDRVQQRIDDFMRERRRSQGYRPMPDGYFVQVVDSYTDTLIEIGRECERRNIRYAAVLQPELGQKPHRSEEEIAILETIDTMIPFYREGYSPVYDRFIKASKERLSQAGIDALDASSHLAFLDERGTMFIDSAHFNRRGNEIVAAMLHEFVHTLDTE